MRRVLVFVAALFLVAVACEPVYLDVPPETTTTTAPHQTTPVARYLCDGDTRPYSSSWVRPELLRPGCVQTETFDGYAYACPPYVPSDVAFYRYGVGDPAFEPGGVAYMNCVWMP